MVVKSPEARKYQAGIEAIAREQLGPRVRFPMYRGPVAVNIVVYRPRKAGDLDNTLKVMLDALKGVAFVDDNQVLRITADRDDDAERPRAEIIVQPRLLAGQQTALELADEECSTAVPTKEKARGTSEGV